MLTINKVYVEKNTDIHCVWLDLVKYHDEPTLLAKEVYIFIFKKTFKYINIK